MSITSVTCLLFISIQLINFTEAQEEVKRVPQGFVGMRGKKYTDEIEHFFKRKPQFFVGVKGKKNFDDSEESINYKRVPMGFVGMRGKKDYDLTDYLNRELQYIPKRASLIGQIDYTSNEDALKETAEFPLLNRILNTYLEEIRQQDNQVTDNNQTVESNELGPLELPTNEIEKRAANFHQFYGVRGKKSVQNKRPFDLSFRGKFIGVRGKKDLKDSGAQEIKFLLDKNGPWPKRKGQINGFFGMRGKKWTDESSAETAYLN